jgi:hypothetical protein
LRGEGRSGARGCTGRDRSFLVRGQTPASRGGAESVGLGGRSGDSSRTGPCGSRIGLGQARSEAARGCDGVGPGDPGVAVMPVMPVAVWVVLCGHGFLERLRFQAEPRAASQQTDGTELQGSVIGNIPASDPHRHSSADPSVAQRFISSIEHLRKEYA